MEIQGANHSKGHCVLYKRVWIIILNQWQTTVGFCSKE